MDSTTVAIENVQKWTVLCCALGLSVMKYTRIVVTYHPSGTNLSTVIAAPIPQPRFIFHRLVFFLTSSKVDN